MPDSIVIVGANLAGGTAAATLREDGYDGTITLIGAEPDPPYERPPLSKEYLRGEMEFAKALVRPAEWWHDNRIDARFGTQAERIDTGDRAVLLAGGERVAYDALLIATGGRNRRPPIPGIDLAGVHQLRTHAEADALRADARDGARAVVVGMGFIGAEVAASLRSSGVEVTVVEPNPLPLGRVFGADIGGAFRDLHADHGVTMIFEDVADAFEGGDRVERVRTKSGRVLECDLAVVGVGIQPNVEIADGTPVEVDNGIVVDEHCRTNVDGVYAAGDVANHWHPLFGKRLRVEHWQNAIKQGEAAARSILGKTEPYNEVHWFWSDQFDENIQYAGHHGPEDALVLRGATAERNFVGFYLDGDRLTAAVAMNRGRDLRAAQKLIANGVRVDEKTLRDEDVSLKSLLPA